MILGLLCEAVFIKHNVCIKDGGADHAFAPPYFVPLHLCAAIFCVNTKQ